jgi:hypothetical protein
MNVYKNDRNLNKSIVIVSILLYCFVKLVNMFIYLRIMNSGAQKVVSSVHGEAHTDKRWGARYGGWGLITPPRGSPAWT